MADLRFRQVVTNVSCTGAAAQTLIQLKAPTNQRMVIREIGVSFAGTTNTDAPALVRLMRQTTAGTSSTGTPAVIDDDLTETLQTVANITYTVEPTYGAVLASWYVHQQTGIIVPLSTIRPIVIKGGGRVGLVVTAGATVSASAYIEADE